VSDEREAGEARAVPDAETPDDAAPVAEDATGPDVEEFEVSIVKAETESEAVVDEAVEDGGPVDAEAAEDTGSSERVSELVGAVSAGSARAAARRSGVRAGTTPAKGTATRPRDTGRVRKDNIFARLSRFLREVVAELRKVIWPARNQMVTYTIVVIIFVVVMVALTAGLDVLFAKGVLSIFG